MANNYYRFLIHCFFVDFSNSRNLVEYPNQMHGAPYLNCAK